MKYDMIVSDFDWTLGCAPGIIEKGTVKAIKEYVNKGGIFVICTGRMYRAIQPVCEKYGIKGLIACYQGCLIEDTEGNKVLDQGLSPQVAADVVEKLSSEKVVVIADIDDELYYESESEYLDIYQNLIGLKGKKVNDLKNFVIKKGKSVQKVCALCDDDTNQKIRDKYNAYYNGEKVLFNSGAKCLVEAINPKYDKGHAVKFLANYYNIPLSKIMTVGDSTNDVPLLSGEWHGVAVGDAKDEAKKAAKEITVPFNENPVKVLIEKYCR